MSIIDKPTDYFNTVLYTGTGGTQSITGVGFQPDLIWGKNRSATGSHNLVDSVRGVSKVIYSNLTDAEATDTSSYNAFGSDGFTMGSQSNINGSGNNIVSWNWKAGTSFTNDASATGIGTIDSTGSVNQDAGFSIVSYTGNGTSGTTVAHGLGTTPDMYITKNRDYAYGWGVYHKSLGANYGLFLNDTVASTAGTGWRNNTAPTSSVFTLGGEPQPYRWSSNKSGNDYIAYCFAEKQGFSKFGSYTANNSSDGTFIYTGFKPAFAIFKKSSGTEAWHIHDNKRSAFNPANAELYANESQAEDTNVRLDLLSNGIKMRTDGGGYNYLSNTYIYMAIAENPFVTSTGVPATAR